MALLMLSMLMMVVVSDVCLVFVDANIPPAAPEQVKVLLYRRDLELNPPTHAYSAETLQSCDIASEDRCCRC